jgi:hypothetical protein
MACIAPKCTSTELHTQNPALCFTHYSHYKKHNSLEFVDHRKTSRKARIPQHHNRILHPSDGGKKVFRKGDAMLSFIYFFSENMHTSSEFCEKYGCSASSYEHLRTRTLKRLKYTFNLRNTSIYIVYRTFVIKGDTDNINQFVVCKKWGFDLPETILRDIFIKGIKLTGEKVECEICQKEYLVESLQKHTRRCRGQKIR